MQLDQRTHEGEAEARALPPVGGIRTIEALEDVWKVLRRDAWARVGNLEQGVVAVAPQRDRRTTTARRVLDRVVGEVQHHAQQLRHVPPDDEAGSGSHVDSDSRALAERP